MNTLRSMDGDIKKDVKEPSSSSVTGFCYGTSKKRSQSFFHLVVNAAQTITNINESVETLTVCIVVHNVELPALASLFGSAFVEDTAPVIPFTVSSALT